MKDKNGVTIKKGDYVFCDKQQQIMVAEYPYKQITNRLMFRTVATESYETLSVTDLISFNETDVEIKKSITTREQAIDYIKDNK